MIQSGGWSGIRTSDEHTKLARVALSYSPELDEKFKIDIGKMKIPLPSELKSQLKEITKPLVSTAKDRYNKKDPDLPKPHPKPRERKYTLAQVKEMLAYVSEGEELPVINRLFDKLRRGHE